MMPGLSQRTLWIAAGLGLLAGLLFNAWLNDELAGDEQISFYLLSPLVTGLAAMVALQLATRNRRLLLGGAVAALGFGALAFLALDTRFVVREPADAGSRSIGIITGWDRDQDCECRAKTSDRECPSELYYEKAKLDACWPERRIIKLALILAHLLVLIGLGGVVGPRHLLPKEPSTRDDHYLDLHVRIDPGEGEAYIVNARTADGRHQSGTFTLPRDLSRPGDPKILGGELFEAVFRGDVRSLLRAAREDRRRARRGLRIRLDLQKAPRLAPLSWEFLYDKKGDGFLALSRDTPVVRGLERVEPYQSLAVAPPLRVLVAVAQPAELPALDVEREVHNIRDALRPLKKEKLVDLELLRPGSWEEVSTRLQRGGGREQVHVFHFIGHGGLTDGEREGALAFEGARGEPANEITGEILAKQLTDHGTVLAVLNACHGASVPQQAPLAGVAQTLLTRGLPAVVAMQKAVSDAAAIAFARWFYRALAVGYPVDAALSEVRKLLAGLRAGGDEWGTPVLYLHASNGRLFDVEGMDPREWLKHLRKEAGRRAAAP